MKVIITLLIGLIISPIASMAQEVSIKDAKKIATNYFYQNTQDNLQRSYNSLDLTVNHIEAKEDNLFYVFDITGHDGFVIVSAQDFTKPILAYSDKNNIDFNNLSPELKYMLDGYSEQIKYGIDHHARSNEAISRKWQQLQIVTANRTSVVDNLGPLLLTEWDQRPYYNDFCPTDVDGNHAVVGCVAVAMAQAIKYYDYPTQGEGERNNIDDQGDVQQDSTIDYSKENYAWNNMPSALSGENEDVAKLMYHCGHIVKMNWEVSSSGAWTSRVVEGLKTYYKYRSDGLIEYKRQNYDGSYNYTDEEWEQMIRDELDLLRPIVYSGYSDDGGHAWNCDGYQSDGGDGYLYHMNYGWGGYGNGYFALDDLLSGTTPDGDEYYFDRGHQIIVGIYPRIDYPSNCQEVRRINGFEGLLGDGSGNAFYQNNLDCQTIIEPKCKTGKVTLSFLRFDLAEGDQVYIYNGTSVDDPVLAILDANNLPEGNYTSDNEGLLIRFVTDNSGVAGGWDAEYTSSTCSVVTKTASSGMLSDGSGSCDYEPGLSCYFYVEPTDATHILFRFSEFDLDTPDKDYLKIYDGETNTELVKYQSSNPPTGDFLVNSSKAYIKFKTYSDENVGKGWKLNYYTGDEGVNEVVDFENQVKIYPNPFETDAVVEISNLKANSIRLILTDIAGKQLAKKEIKQQNNISIIHLSDIYSGQFDKGFYLLTLQIGDKIKTYKLVSE